MKGRRFEFRVRDWIDTKEGLVAQRNLALSSNGFQDQPPKPSLKSRKLGIQLLRSYFTALSFFTEVESLNLKSLPAALETLVSLFLQD